MHCDIDRFDKLAINADKTVEQDVMKDVEKRLMERILRF